MTEQTTAKTYTAIITDGGEEGGQYRRPVKVTSDVELSYAQVAEQARKQMRRGEVIVSIDGIEW